MRRFLVGPVHPGTEIELPPGESRHASKSLRLQTGAKVVLFDGAGAEWDGEIVQIDGPRVVVRVAAARDVAAVRRFTIAVAVPKGNRLDWMIEKLAELGAAEILLVRFHRSVAAAGKRPRLERLAAAGAKQSGRARIPTIGGAEFKELLERVNGGCRVASPGAERTLVQAGAELVVIGPEGGLTPDEERELAARGAERVSLGSHILRIETAAVAAAAVCAQL